MPDPYDGPPTIHDGLPEGWSFQTVEHGDFVTYEVWTDLRCLIMSSTWNRSLLSAPEVVDHG